jgi:hypothetical protein
VNTDLMFSTGNDVVVTPRSVFDPLHAEFGFGCDVAATLANRRVPTYLGPDHVDPTRRDALEYPWPTNKPNWLNPPYSKEEFPCKGWEQGLFSRCTKKICEKRGYHNPVYVPGCYQFVERAAEQRLEGATTVCLLAARTDTEWWHDFVWDRAKHKLRPGVEVRFIRGRIVFEGAPAGAPFPSVLVIFRGAGCAE